MTAIDKCEVCRDPASATWEQRAEHGCSFPGEVQRCAWCGKAHKVESGAPIGLAMWCAGCQEQHKAANPDAWWFKGWTPIEDTLPGRKYDGIWEESGLTIGDDGSLKQTEG